MKIGIEASAVFRKQKTGIGWYSYCLTQALTDEMPSDSFLLCYLSFITKRPEKLSPSPANVSYKRVNFFPGKIYNYLDHNLIAPPIDLLARVKADVFIFPNFFRWPLWFCKRSIVIIHDLGFIETPQYLTPRMVRYLGRRVPQSARKATGIVTISESTKRQLIKQYGIAPDKISVAVPGVDLEKYHAVDPAEVDAVKQKYGIEGKYLLYLGTIEPRKNITSILGAYNALPAETQSEYKLVLAGGKGWLDDDIQHLADTLPLNALVKTGYVDNGDEPALYTGATLFLYPSHYEGWGMQIPEAMACGTPVITANNSSLHEAGGDAAYYLLTNNTAGITRAINELLADPKQRAKMKQAGLEHVKQFTWEAAARIVADRLRSIA